MIQNQTKKMIFWLIYYDLCDCKSHLTHHKQVIIPTLGTSLHYDQHHQTEDASSNGFSGPRAYGDMWRGNCAAYGQGTGDSYIWTLKHWVPML